MNTLSISPNFALGAVVAPAHDLGGVQSPGGSMVPRERLGPGIVERLQSDGWVLIRWVGAGFDTWLDPGDVQSLGVHAHLLTINRRDKWGESKLEGYKVAAEAGLEYNWTVEWLPNNVVRTLRPDGCSWTFTFNPLFKRIELFWAQQLEDEDAEALTVAELSVGKDHHLFSSAHPW